MTALTQYDDRAFYPEVAGNKELILETIRACFEQGVRPALEGKGIFPGDSYVADFGIVLERREGQVVGAHAVLIELNRFARCAGTSLFSWREDFDVLTGAKPFEFRIASEEQFKDCEWRMAWSVDSLKTEIKREIYQGRTSWFERWFMGSASGGDSSHQ
jgi:hypothetical protein